MEKIRHRSADGCVCVCVCEKRSQVGIEEVRVCCSVTLKRTVRLRTSTLISMSSRKRRVRVGDGECALPDHRMILTQRNEQRSKR